MSMSNHEELERSWKDAEEAMRKATKRRMFGFVLARGWRESRNDNNFRAMILSIGGWPDAKTDR